MKLLLAATLVLVLSAIAIAVPDSQQLGPYSVSFDLNANYQPQIAPPMETETANTYQMRLFVDNSTYSVVGITEYAELEDATPEVLKTIMGMNMLLSGFNASIPEDRKIDGKDGFLIPSVPFQVDNNGPSMLYRALYWLDSEKCECGPIYVGKTSVVVTSTFSQDVTESLLSSLHILKGEAAAPEAGGQVLLPA